jgi:hypothetical protein
MKLKFDHRVRLSCARGNALGKPQVAALPGARGRAPEPREPGREPRRGGQGPHARGLRPRALGGQEPRARAKATPPGSRDRVVGGRGHVGTHAQGARDAQGGGKGREREREREGRGAHLGIQKPAITVIGSPRARGGRMGDGVTMRENQMRGR